MSKKVRMTSLSLALYLANVQRANCPNPFPRSSIEKREVVKQIQSSKQLFDRCQKVKVRKCQLTSQHEE
jgi:hypothetical protein